MKIFTLLFLPLFLSSSEAASSNAHFAQSGISIDGYINEKTEKHFAVLAVLPPVPKRTGSFALTEDERKDFENQDALKSGGAPLLVGRTVVRTTTGSFAFDELHLFLEDLDPVETEEGDMVLQGTLKVMTEEGDSMRIHVDYNVPCSCSIEAIGVDDMEYESVPLDDVGCEGEHWLGSIQGNEATVLVSCPVGTSDEDLFVSVAEVAILGINPKFNANQWCGGWDSCVEGKLKK